MYPNHVLPPHPSFPSLVDPSLIPKSAQKISKSVQFSSLARDSPRFSLISDELGWSNKRGSLLLLHLEDHIKVYREVEFFLSLYLEDHIKRCFGGQVETHHLKDHIKATSTLRSTNTSAVICLSQKTTSPRGSHQIEDVEPFPPRGSHQIYHVETLSPRGSHQIQHDETLSPQGALQTSKWLL